MTGAGCVALCLTGHGCRSVDARAGFGVASHLFCSFHGLAWRTLRAKAGAGRSVQPDMTTLPEARRSKLMALFEKHAGVVLRRQLSALPPEGIDGRWDIDFQTVPWRLRVRSEVCDATLPARLIGMETNAGEWLWGWDAPHTPDALIASVRRVRAFGEEHGIAALTTPRLPLEVINGHAAATITCGLTRAPNYYVIPHDGGTMYALLGKKLRQGGPEATTFDVFNGLNLLRFEFVFGVERAFVRYLKRRRIVHSIAEDGSIEVHEEGPLQVFEFAPPVFGDDHFSPATG